MNNKYGGAPIHLHGGKVNKNVTLLGFSILAIVIGIYSHCSLKMPEWGHFIAGGAVMWGNAGISAWARNRDSKLKTN